MNLFHGRAYARPHDIEIQHQAAEGALRAQIEHIAPRGAVVRVELKSSGAAGTVEAELTRERSRELGLAPGQLVYIRPRALRVFG